MNVHDSDYSVMGHGKTEVFVGPFEWSTEGNQGWHMCRIKQIPQPLKCNKSEKLSNTEVSLLKLQFRPFNHTKVWYDFR